ncbi:biotin-dependent carboxyltransferase family protein [Aquimarina sp. 2201CG5-10]|uniref:5-oxoprolinase subunit C family protein n=1 Tax=Aquimarina callyspongiae TaxID=3098150 RepID=UPI002AB41AF5|nr:biotin-dependent carboxyltransferase family protein [Aquimarina sp. 2201CG5-10]MDY8138072.1 biotin-dependent carboxyltransferase family protein [Aquimarina sp. 2201CG5-10]
MNGEVKIIRPGIYTSIQDLGRFGFSKYGIPKSGAMDQMSVKLANAILGNDENDAVLEWTMQGPILQFSEQTIIVLTGAEVDAFLNKKKIKKNKQFSVDKNDILELKYCKNNMYGYVGIKNGFKTEITFNSRSFFKGITRLEKLKKGDVVPYQKNENFEEQYASVLRQDYDQNSLVLKAFKGPEFDLLTSSEKESLKNMNFTISNIRSRMAIQLNETIVNKISSMLTSPVLPGTIQLTPSGKLIVLMRDCQTTGGYPRILQLFQEDINNIAQKRTGENIKFKIIT